MLLLLASVIGVLLFFIIKNAPPTTIKSTLASMMLGSILWNVSTLLTLTKYLHIVAPLVYISVAYFCLARFWFIHTYIHEGAQNKKLHRLLTLVGIGIVIISLYPGLLYTDIYLDPGGYIVASNGPLTAAYKLFLVYVIAKPTFDLYFYIKRIKPRDKTKRAQTKLIFWGTVIYTGIATFSNGILSTFFHVYFFNTIGPAFSIIADAFISYVVFTYQFLKIKHIAQRGLIYIILVSIIISVYVVLLISIPSLSFVYHVDIEILRPIITISTLVIGIFTIPKIERFLQHITDPIFFKSTYEYTSVADELSSICSRYQTRNEVIYQTIRFIKSRLHFSKITFSKKLFWDCIDQECAVENVHSQTGDVLGAIIAKEKMYGDPITKKDKQILKLYARILGIALEKAILYEELDERIQKRTDEVRELMSEKQHMYRELAHALQTPLTILKGTVDTIKQNDCIDQKTRKIFEKSIFDTSEVVQSILTIQKKTSETQDLTTTQGIISGYRTNISALVEDIVEYVEPLCEAKQITLTYSIEPSHPVRGTDRELEEAFVNILSNSVRHMHDDDNIPRRILLTVTDSPLTEHVHISIADTGKGIPTEDIPHIFNINYKAKNNTLTEGAGIGLMITKKIIESCGGTITLTSELGKGTTTLVKLPYAHNHSHLLNTK